MIRCIFPVCCLVDEKKRMRVRPAHAYYYYCTEYLEWVWPFSCVRFYLGEETYPPPPLFFFL
jgi:hypothetical protein